MFARIVPPLATEIYVETARVRKVRQRRMSVGMEMSVDAGRMRRTQLCRTTPILLLLPQTTKTMSNTDNEVIIIDEAELPTMVESRLLQNQDGTTIENACVNRGEFTVCPTGANFNFGGLVKQLTAEIQCPLDSVTQNDFRLASQQGLCECEAFLQDLNVTDSSPEPINCQCFICPSSDNRFGVAYTCDRPVAGPCHTFDCTGTCNDNLDFINDFTRSPTVSPLGAGDDDDDAAFQNGLPFVTTVAMVLLVVRMFR